MVLVGVVYNCQKTHPCACMKSYAPDFIWINIGVVSLKNCRYSPYFNSTNIVPYINIYIKHNTLQVYIFRKLSYRKNKTNDNDKKKKKLKCLNKFDVLYLNTNKMKKHLFMICKRFEL